MSKKLSYYAADILDRVETALLAAEELGGTVDTDDYLLLMEKVATLAAERYNAAAEPRGFGESMTIHQITA